MGERLNIEIHNKGKILANCYYHWSGYSNSAVSLSKQIIDEIVKNSELRPESDLLYAIRLLELTGAGLTEDELNYAKSLDELKNIEFAECNGRNEGLISISPNGIKETRNWQEHALYIYLDEQRMSFKVFWSKRKWDWERERKEDYEEEVKANDLERVDINFDDVKFTDINAFVEFVNSHLQDAFMTTIDWDNVYDMIY